MINGIEFAAIGTAICIAVSSLIATDVARTIGAFTFTKYRMFFSAIILIPICTIFNYWQNLHQSTILLLIISGIIGIVVGDVAIYSSMSKIGPKRTSIIFSINSAISVLMAFVFYDQTLTYVQLFAIAIISISIYVVIKNKDYDTSQGELDTITGDFKKGVYLALLAALCQASGAVLAAPAMESDISAIAATAIRVSSAAICFIGLSYLPQQKSIRKELINKKIIIKIATSALIGMCAGMTLLMLALSSGKIGISMTYASLTPIALAVILFFISKTPPSNIALIGIIFSISGTFILLYK